MENESELQMIQPMSVSLNKKLNRKKQFWGTFGSSESFGGSQKNLGVCLAKNNANIALLGHIIRALSALATGTGVIICIVFAKSELHFCSWKNVSTAQMNSIWCLFFLIEITWQCVWLTEHRSHTGFLFARETGKKEFLISGWQDLCDGKFSKQWKLLKGS